MGTDATGDVPGSWTSPVVLQPPAAGQPPGLGWGRPLSEGCPGAVCSRGIPGEGDALAPQLALVNVLHMT